MNVVAAVELNRHACATYRHNLVVNEVPTLYEADIRTLDPNDFQRAHFAADTGCDIVLGGPPCQGFSAHRLKDAGVDDPRNQLIFKYFEFVEVLRPKAFLMENVPGMLWPRHKDFLDKFYSRGRAAGYQLRQPELLDARDFGIPQRRKRLFILGVRNDITFLGSWPPSRTHGDEKQRREQTNLLPWVNSHRIFLDPVHTGDENDVHMNHTKELTAVFESTPPNGGSRSQSNRILRCHKGHSGHSDVYGRIDPSAPGPTMTTACINPSKGRFVHPTKHHGITLRQAARFQTFPDKFVFKGKLMSAGAQIGNAVPVRMGEILLRAVADGLSDYTCE